MLHLAEAFGAVDDAAGRRCREDERRVFSLELLEFKVLRVIDDILDLGFARRVCFRPLREEVAQFRIFFIVHLSFP